MDSGVSAAFSTLGRTPAALTQAPLHKLLNIPLVEPISSNPDRMLPTMLGTVAALMVLARRRLLRRSARSTRGGRLFATAALEPASVLGGSIGPFAADFAFPHWLWQHSIARFEAARLASGAVSDLAAAWDLHHTYGYIAHAEVEDMHMFPALRKLTGGEAVVASLNSTHLELDAKANEIAEALRTSQPREHALGLLGEWQSLLQTHMDEEEQHLTPLISSMPKAELSALSDVLKTTGEDAPGAKMILCLFRDLAASGGVVQSVYDNSFPMILRYGVIPMLSNIDTQYAEHRRIFGDLKQAVTR